MVDMWGNEDQLAVEEEWPFTDKSGKEVDRGKSPELWKMEKWKLYVTAIIRIK
jgi:hypothetical protein